MSGLCKGLVRLPAALIPVSRLDPLPLIERQLPIVSQLFASYQLK